MAPQAYKVINNNYQEISGWTILYIIIHVHIPHLGGTNDYVQHDLSTLAFKNREQLEDIYIIIIILQQEIILSGETISHTRLLLQYTKAL